MKYRCFLFVLLSALSLDAPSAYAQRECGQSIIFRQMQQADPVRYAQMRDDHAKFAAAATMAKPGTAAKPAAYNPLPLAFHFVLTTAQWNALGRDTGIRRRVLSQIDVLNQDFNRGNGDTTLIPSGFKSSYANIGIRFALANTTTQYTKYPGIEVKLTPLGYNPIYSVDDLCYKAKRNTDTGLAAWDPSKYLNIWVCNISTSTGMGVILGITTPPSFNGKPWHTRTIDPNEIGLVINFGAFGRKEYESQYFIDGIDLGRTTTHEMGHFFELYHTWGDDQDLGSGNNCPGDMSGNVQIGFDDDIADTPPEGNPTLCSNGNCPAYPLYDKCSPSGNGVMFMNYMDYVDDKAMQMFTTQQSQLMTAALITESVSLIQHPELVGVKDVTAFAGNVQLLPNPAQGNVRLSLDRLEGFRGADVVNMMGQTVVAITPQGASTYDLNLSAAPRGVYFVRCHYDGGTLTQKLILE